MTNARRATRRAPTSSAMNELDRLNLNPEQYALFSDSTLVRNTRSKRALVVVRARKLKACPPAFSTYVHTTRRSRSMKTSSCIRQDALDFLRGSARNGRGAPFANGVHHLIYLALVIRNRGYRIVRHADGTCVTRSKLRLPHSPRSTVANPSVAEIEDS